MAILCLYIIELTDIDEGGLELVDPSWCKYYFSFPKILLLLFFFFKNNRTRYGNGNDQRIRCNDE